MIDFLLQVAFETWTIFKQAAIFLLLGFLFAGVLAVLVPERVLAKLFRTGKVKSVLWASTVGAPLPLCSCGVVPAAIGLRKQGATPGATVSFLISTPETGADSISLTYALMDPIITIFRPVVAVLTAITAGLGVNLLERKKPLVEVPPDAASSVQAESAELAQPHAHSHGHHHSGAHDHAHASEVGHAQPSPAQGAGWRYKLGQIYHYAFRQLLDDISYWVVFGIVLSGIVAAVVPPTFFEQYLSNELASMLVMLLIGIPIYVCASEATPLAAALVLKGLNPGAALVFLLAGPATNIGSIVVLFKLLGARIMAIYLGAIVIVSLTAGFALNWVYRAWELNPQATFGKAAVVIPEPIKIAAALLLMTLLVLSMRRAALPSEWLWLRGKLSQLIGVWINARRILLSIATFAGALYVGSGLFTIAPGEVGFKSRFGAIVAHELAPGLHYRLPWPFESHQVIQKERVRRIEFGFGAPPPPALPVRSLGRERITAAGWNNPTPEQITVPGTWYQRGASAEEPFFLTGDGNLISLKSALQYRVKDPLAYAFNLTQPEGLLRSAAMAALRRTMATNDIDAIYTSARGALERSVGQETQRILDRARSGLEIVAFRLLYVHAPDAVHDAFRDVASAQEDKIRTINRAHIFAVEGVNQARGEAAASVEQALAFKAQQIRHAEGEATSFSLKLEEYRRAPELTKFRLQLETIESALPGVQKFVRPGAGEIKDFDMWLLQPAGIKPGN